jgi:hypothetical protein
MEAVFTMGPLAVGVDPSPDSFLYYKEGVYTSAECDIHNLDHQVILFGYGTTEDGQDYWLMKNMWSKFWGNDGYMKVGGLHATRCPSSYVSLALPSDPSGTLPHPHRRLRAARATAASRPTATWSSCPRAAAGPALAAAASRASSGGDGQTRSEREPPARRCPQPMALHVLVRAAVRAAMHLASPGLSNDGH